MGSSSSSNPPLRLTFEFSAVVVFIALLLPSPTLSGPVYSPSITPNLTTSYFHSIDNSGAFLASSTGSFEALITNTKPGLSSYYFVVIHVSSHTIVWTANRDNPISQTSELSFTNRGLFLYNDTVATGHQIWSTPQNLSSVSSLLLLDSGNLVLLDSSNNSVWESFDSPTDVLVAGQRLRVGQSLVSSVSDEDLSQGGYQLVVGDRDAMLQWNGMIYWKLSMDTRAFIDTSLPVNYMVMNFTGLYLMGSRVVIRVILHNPNDAPANSSSFRIVKLDRNGVFSVQTFKEEDGSVEYRGPTDSCSIPFVCRKLGICTNGGSCQCAPGFRIDPGTNNCVPTDASLSLPRPCDGSSSMNGTGIKYLNLRSDLDYFSNSFISPTMQDVSQSVCENNCSMNCSCLGFFYGQNSRSCYLVRNHLGSLFVRSPSSTMDPSRVGYVKAIVTGDVNGGDSSDPNKGGFPLVQVVLWPTSGVLVIVLIGVIYFLRRRKRRQRKWAKSKAKKLDEDIDFVLIPGLPVRFDYAEIAAATNDFRTQIGSGGFGTVFKGTLGDGTDIAVKKMTCLGSEGKREFLTEIAIIGKIHHVNLVRLKGFCAHEGKRFLVYEYMNRGSLDCNLFRGESVMEWKERYEIALSTARGLAYLHSGCEHKIIHCDVKPENILLHDKSQVKISDFGLSKLLSPEQSGLFTTLRGTRGYLAPEWLTSSAISDKTDVYSYGMVLLEIISGKKNSSPRLHTTNSSEGMDSNGNVRSSPSSGESGRQRLVYFPLFALEMHEAGQYLDLVDPRLNGRVRSDELEKLVRVALCCVQEEPSLRPSMTNVVGMLEGGVALGNPRISSLNFLRFYGRRFTEASRLGGGDDSNNEHADAECFLHRQRTTTSSTSLNPFSYMSSQQVSGPR